MSALPIAVGIKREDWRVDHPAVPQTAGGHLSDGEGKIKDGGTGRAAGPSARGATVPPTPR